MERKFPSSVYSGGTIEFNRPKTKKRFGTDETGNDVMVSRTSWNKVRRKQKNTQNHLSS